MKRDIKVIRETIAENKENVKALELKFNNHSHEIKDIKIVNK
ncbi:hypothetical protein [Orenia metallireducens]|nr:hypothetical protein [Orenia metallireducens]